MDKILTFKILHDLDGIPIEMSFILLIQMLLEVKV